MIKTLYSTGCSWTFGIGAEENPEWVNGMPHINFAWPKFLGEHLGAEKVINESTGGGSNTRMLRKLTNFLRNLPLDKRAETFVAIGWSTIDRDEIYIDKVKAYRRFNAGQPFSTYRTQGLTKSEINAIDKYQEMYVSEIYSHHHQFEKFLNQVFYAHMMLQNLGIKYVMFSALPWKGPHWFTPDELIAEFSNEIETNNINYIDYHNSMMHFCYIRDLKLSTCIHPLLPGHIEWAKYMMEFIQENNLLGDKQ